MRDIDVDASRPASTITAVAYDSTANTITLTGTNFDQIESATTDIKAQLDWISSTGILMAMAQPLRPDVCCW